MGKPFVDMVGLHWGKDRNLFAVERVEDRVLPSGQRQVRYRFNCLSSRPGCRRVFETDGASVRKGSTSSCGCLKSELMRNRALDTCGIGPGYRSNRLTAMSWDRSRRKWRCRCVCGKRTLVSTNKLKRGDTQSCGCARLGKTALDLKGQKFGQLTCERRLARRRGDSNLRWSCRCECGKRITVAATKLVSKQHPTRSCGCLRVTGAQERVNDLVGVASGFLTVVERLPSTERGVMWRCSCKCGGGRDVPADHLATGRVKSCGCLGAGRSYGELELEAIIKIIYPDAHHSKRHWGSRSQELDIFIPSAAVAVEFDGPQHRGPMWYDKNSDAYARRRSNDRRKNRLCKEAGIHLIRVRDDVYAKDPQGVTKRILAEIASCSK